MPKANALLSQIESSVWGEVQNRLTPVQLERGQVLQRPGEDLGSVYFPTSAVLALGLETLAGESVNVTLLGREGGLGVFEACGSRQSYTRATAWVAGTVWRLPASAYREMFANSSVLRREIHKYVEILLAERRLQRAAHRRKPPGARAPRRARSIGRASPAHHPGCDLTPTRGAADDDRRVCVRTSAAGPHPQRSRRDRNRRY